MSSKPNFESELELALAGERNLLVADALRRAGAGEEGIDLLTARLGKRVRLASNDGARSIEVLDADGAATAASLDELVSEAKSHFASLFQAPSSAPQPIARAKSDFLTERERSQFVNAHGLAAYEALPAKSAPTTVVRKGDFVSEAHRARWVNRHGLAAYNKLPA